MTQVTRQPRGDILLSDHVRRIGEARRVGQIWYPLACGMLAVFAFLFNWIVGHRGIYLLDQSMVFDGAWRILQGQIPYKDFLIPFTPLTFYIQAVFFRFFGVNWSAMVVSACVLSSLATLSGIRVVRLLGGNARWLGLCGGLATAVSLQAPFGTLWFENTAMFFDLLALQAAVESFRLSGYRRALWTAAGGSIVILALLNKQNYGLFFIPVLFVVVVAGNLPDARRAWWSIVSAAVGLVAMACIFGVWVVTVSDTPSFIQRALVVAGEIGRSRLKPTVLVDALSFTTVVPNRFQFDLIGPLVGGGVLLVACFNFRTSIWRRTAPACTAAILLPIFRSVAQAATANDWENNFAFGGLAVCLALSAFLQIVDRIGLKPAVNEKVKVNLPTSRTIKCSLLVAAGLWTVAALGHIGLAAWTRTVQEFNRTTSFKEGIRVRGLEKVHWGEPTIIDGETVLRRADLEALVHYLATRRTNFFVMGDSTLLYGLLGMPSPQPLLYFYPSHAFLENEIPSLDEMILTTLKRNRVDVIVREKTTYVPAMHTVYSRFLHTWAWFTSSFERMADFGNYEIWERREGTQ